MDLLASIAGEVLELHRAVHQAVADELRALAGGGGSLAAAAATALALGMIHALTPGHGKAVLFVHFLGRQARPWAGIAAGAQVAALHVGSATLLVLAVGAASSALGRPSGAAAALQGASALAVTALGCWYLWLAFRRADTPPVAAASHSHTGVALAVGLLPCPLTMLILSAALAHDGLGVGLALVLVMGVGIMMTIGLIGSIGIAGQRGIVAGLNRSARYARLLHGLEIASAAVILAFGVIALAAL